MKLIEPATWWGNASLLLVREAHEQVASVASGEAYQIEARGDPASI